MVPSVSFPLPLRIAQKLPVRNSWELIILSYRYRYRFVIFELIREVLANTLYFWPCFKGYFLSTLKIILENPPKTLEAENSLKRCLGYCRDQITIDTEIKVKRNNIISELITFRITKAKAKVKFGVRYLCGPECEKIICDNQYQYESESKELFWGN